MTPEQHSFIYGRLRPFLYLAGLLNRMTIPAIAASPFIRAAKKKQRVPERRGG
jgi:hypothetical protein